MADYTLITSIGTGMYKKEGGYRITTYLFNNGKTYESRLFFDAILKTEFKPIKKIIFIGTYTSSWDVLIDDKKDSNLWADVYEEINEKGLSPDSELIPKIKAHLKEQYSVEIEILIHTNIIDADTTEEIFNIYKSVVPYIREDSNVLFDITHGFRSMPILMYQTLQFASNGKTEIQNVELIYGEYIENEKISRVRDLSNYWHYARITDAFSVFKTKLDGFILSALLEKEYESYSKVINKISGIVQTNFCLQIIEVLIQLKNVLTENHETPPFWFSEIKSFLADFYKKIYSSKSEARTIFNFAKYLRERDLNTQAIISLQLAVETACAEKSDNPEKNKGNYDFWQSEGKITRKEVISSDCGLKRQILNLESFRNQIAHGGAKDNKTNASPSSDSIAKNFDSGTKGVETFLSKLGL